MKRSTAAEKAIQKNLEILQAHGINFDTPIEEMKRELLSAGAEVVQSRSEALEATLSSIRKPGDFTYRNCIRCGETFGADYKSVGYCSDHCRISHLYDTTGIRVTAGRSEVERWGGEPPMIIPPSVLKVMVPYAERILEMVAALKEKERIQKAEEAELWVQLELEFPEAAPVELNPPPTETPESTSLLPLPGKAKPFVLKGMS